MNNYKSLLLRGFFTNEDYNNIKKDIKNKLSDEELKWYEICEKKRTKILH